MALLPRLGWARAGLLASALWLPPSAAPAAECFCRSRDGPVAMGQRLCVPTPAGWRVAVCIMDINVMSWRPTEESCAPTARRPGGGATL